VAEEQHGSGSGFAGNAGIRGLESRFGLSSGKHINSRLAQKLPVSSAYPAINPSPDFDLMRSRYLEEDVVNTPQPPQASPLSGNIFRRLFSLGFSPNSRLLWLFGAVHITTELSKPYDRLPFGKIEDGSRASAYE